jgi:Acetyltransferase (GNAT) domain
LNRSRLRFIHAASIGRRAWETSTTDSRYGSEPQSDPPPHVATGPQPRTLGTTLRHGLRRRRAARSRLRPLAGGAGRTWTMAPPTATTPSSTHALRTDGCGWSDVTFLGTAKLVRADASDLPALRGANPAKWGSDEWQDLLDRHLGPWVMARHDQRIISICHTPVSNSRAAEAGVWTHPDFRGQGHAAATTAAWATLMGPGGRVLFCSASQTNRASQRVAARLGLRRIGYLWQLQSSS